MKLPKINDLELPAVVLVHSVDYDLDQLAEKLKTEKMPLEAMIEVAVYLKREKEKADALSAAEKVMRARIDDLYAKMPKKERGTRRTNVGMVTYTDASTVFSIKDRDWTVENLTQEQLRLAFDPSAKACKTLQTILKKEDFTRHTSTATKPAATSLRDLKGDDYEELDF